ncbi:uncharacterized protein TNCT_399701 [Trichonephila clavata]|uniref:Uncharacterized protein n=1 Tax=Trichonephila clavata TaxID=2740835 RepID=A0A8X6KIR5_TRICU|nr:uncharacterized protein TNCT_399701 [Trichonephila clavata]
MERIWDLAKIPKYYENDIERVNYVEHKEDGEVVNQNDSALYTVTIKDVNGNILYSNRYICADVRVTKSTGSSIGEDNVTLVNTGNLFSRATFYIGGSAAIEEIMKPNLVHHINDLVNFTNDYASSEATSMFFYKDTSDAEDRNFLKFEGAHADAEKMTTLIKKIKLNENYNKGFADRGDLTKNSNLTKIDTFETIFWIL